MLPFDNGRESKKAWQCFCCGMETKEGYLQFKEHILLAHEEGREYLLCPKCDAPVRDLRMHYKVHHKGWVLPAGLQHRATVWCDFAPGGKKKKKTSVKFREGSFISSKMNGAELYYRSGYEAEVYELLEQMPHVLSYKNEPFEIPYMYLGQWKKYRPDLFLKFSDDRTQVWEIKPATQTSLPINEAKWSHAHQYCLAKGWEFVVITETGIDKLRKEVAALRKSSN